MLYFEKGRNQIKGSKLLFIIIIVVYIFLFLQDNGIIQLADYELTWQIHSCQCLTGQFHSEKND